MKTLLKGGRVLDPATNLDETCDVLIADGVIAAIEKSIDAKQADRVVELNGQWVTPGLVDIHVHFRDPGRPDKETTASGAQAAIAGGFTAVCIMPNTQPTLDDLPTLEYVQQAAREHSPIHIFPVAAATKKIAGEELTEMKGLYARGAVGFTDDGHCIGSARVMRLALEYATMLGVPIVCHAEDTSLSGCGCMHEGYYSTRLGLPGIPTVAESVIVARDIELARFTGGHVHFAHISTAESIHLIRQAKAEGLKVTAETTPHYLALTDEALSSYDADFKMHAPLRSKEDQAALIEGILDGTIDAIATDHAPHTADEKAQPINQAPNGVIGLETSLAVMVTHFIKTKKLTPLQLIGLMSTKPARVMGLSDYIGTLTVGQPADIAVIDPDATWTVDVSRFKSKSKNSPFKGMTLTGKPMMVFAQGNAVLDELAAVPA